MGNRLTRKKYSMTITKKFSDGTIVGITIGTEIEDSESSEERLAADVYDSTLADLKKINERNAVVKEITEGLKRTLKNEKRIVEGEVALKEEYE